MDNHANLNLIDEAKAQKQQELSILLGTIADQNNIILANNETIKLQTKNIADLVTQKDVTIANNQIQIDAANAKNETYKKLLESSIASLESQKKALTVDIVGLNDKKTSLISIIDFLAIQQADNENNLKNLDDQKIRRLTEITNANSALVSLNQQKNDKQKELDDMQGQINDALLAKTEAQKSLDDIISKLVDANKNLGVIVQKGSFLVDKMDYLNGQEKYVEIYYRKIGLEYQPFQPTTPNVSDAPTEPITN